MVKPNLMQSSAKGEEGLSRLFDVEDAVADEVGLDEDEDGDADRSCCSRSFSRSPLRMYLLAGVGEEAATAAAPVALVEDASSAALRLFAISALRKSIVAGIPYEGGIDVVKERSANERKVPQVMQDSKGSKVEDYKIKLC